MTGRKMNDLELSKSIPQRLALRDQIIDRLSDIFSALNQVLEDVDGVCFGKNSAAYCIQEYMKESIRFPKHFKRDEVRKLLVKNLWSTLVYDTPIWSLMDAMARRQFDDDLERNPPEATLDNLRATINQYIANADEIFRRSLIETFSRLDKDYRTNDAFKLKSAIVMKSLHDDCGRYHRGAEDKLRDLDRVFWVLDNKQMPSRYDDTLAGIMCQHKTKASPIFNAGAGSFETEYFKVRFFKNGSARLSFMRSDLVEKANRMIAEYYGAVIPQERGR